MPPQITGLNPESNLTTGQPFLHWNATDRIANTAVEVNVSRQSPAMVPVTHYYDVTRTAATAIDRLSSSRRSKSIGTNSSVCRSKRTAHAEMVNVAKELRARLPRWSGDNMMAARRVYAADVFTRGCPISLFLQACTFALVVAVWTPAEGAEVPAACRANIDAKLPGWRLATPSAEVAKWAAEMKEGPTVLHVDLDGDGVRDTAALIVTGAGDPPAHHIAVCLSRKAGPELHVIDDLYCSDGIMIAKKGTRAHDFENFRYVTYRTNGVHAYCFEKAGATYLFRNGRFIRIVDSD